MMAAPFIDRKFPNTRLAHSRYASSIEKAWSFQWSLLAGPSKLFMSMPMYLRGTEGGELLSPPLVSPLDENIVIPRETDESMFAV